MIPKTDFDKVNNLVQLLKRKATGEYADPEEYKSLRRELLKNRKLSGILPSWLKEHRSPDSFWDYIKLQFPTYAERRRYISKQFSGAFNLLEFDEIITPQPYQPNPETAPQISNTAKNKQKVFIVHGRDNEIKQEVAGFIEKLGLEAIILHEQASSGRTIIEKIEDYSHEVDFAIILYTACDHGRGIHESNFPPKNRARQNVVFEHGYLTAKLGRKKVCSLVKNGVELPNDISGIVYVPLDDSGAWKDKVVRELKACGYEIKTSCRIDYQTS